VKAGFVLILVAMFGTAFVATRPIFARAPLEWVDGAGRVDLGATVLSAPQTATFRLRNFGERAVSVVDVDMQCSCEGLAVRVDGRRVEDPKRGFSIPAGALAEIVLGFHAREGRHHFSVLLEDDGGNRYEGVATCIGLPDFEVVPRALNLGRVSPGCAARVEFTVRSRTETPFLLANQRLRPESRDGLIEVLGVGGNSVRMRATIVAPMSSGRFGACVEMEDPTGQVLRLPCFGETDLGIEVRPSRLQVVDWAQGAATFALFWDPEKTGITHVERAEVRTDCPWLEAKVVSAERSCTIETRWDVQSHPAAIGAAVVVVRVPQLLGCEVALTVVARGSGGRR
jgi:hypothetical protein